jgi:sugar phosphate isomerase/epimerase
MKLAVSMWSVVQSVRANQIDLTQFVEFVARQEVEGVELLDYFWQDKQRDLPAVKQQVKQLGLAVAAFSIGNDFFLPDAEARAAQLDSLKDGVRTANELETSFLRVFSGNSKVGYEFSDGIGWIVEGLAAGAEYAQQHGVTLVLENHGLMAGRSTQVKGLIDAVGSPALRANLDTGNFLLVGENPTDAARELATYVAYVHLKDFRKARADETSHVYRGSDGVNYTGTAVGEGEVDLARILEILSDNRYDGWLALEYEGSADPVTHGVPVSLQAAKRLLGRS